MSNTTIQNDTSNRLDDNPDKLSIKLGNDNIHNKNINKSDSIDKSDSRVTDASAHLTNVTSRSVSQMGQTTQAIGTAKEIETDTDTKIMTTNTAGVTASTIEKPAPKDKTTDKLNSTVTDDANKDSSKNKTVDAIDKSLSMRVGDVPDDTTNNSIASHLPDNSLQNTSARQKINKNNNLSMGRNLMFLACFVGMGVFAAYWFTLANLQSNDHTNSVSNANPSSNATNATAIGNPTQNTKTIPAIMVKSTKNVQASADANNQATAQSPADNMDGVANGATDNTHLDGVIVPDADPITSQTDTLPDANQPYLSQSGHFVAVAEQNPDTQSTASPSSSLTSNSLNNPSNNSLNNLNNSTKNNAQGNAQSNAQNTQSNAQQANNQSAQTNADAKPKNSATAESKEVTEVMSDAELAGLEESHLTEDSNATANQPSALETQTIKDEQHLTGKDDTGLLDMDLPAGKKEFDATQFEVNDSKVKKLQQQSQNKRNEAEVLHDQISQSISTIKEHNQKKIQQEQTQAKQAYQHKKQSDIQQLEAQLESSTLDNLGRVDTPVVDKAGVNKVSGLNKAGSKVEANTQALDNQPALAKSKKQTNPKKAKPTETEPEKTTADSIKTE